MASIRSIRPLALVLALAALTGCGGSGSSTPAVPQVRFERLTSAQGIAIPTSVSADGTIIAGNADTGQSFVPTLWTDSRQGHAIPETGGARLGTLKAISGDGTTWLGSVLKDGTEMSAVGSADGQKRVLPMLPGTTLGYPIDLSADGSVALCKSGFAFGGAGNMLPYLVTEAGLGNLSGPSGSFGAAIPEALSADGRVIVGQAGGCVARWDVDQVRVLSTRDGAAKDVSADGSVVVGWLMSSQGENVPFRWTEAGGFQELPTVEGARYAIAVAVSADGGTVLINALDPAQNRERVFLWREGVGTQPLEDVVHQAEPKVHFDGVQAAAMSSDAKVIVGGGWTGFYGTRMPAWRLVLP